MIFSFCLMFCFKDFFVHYIKSTSYGYLDFSISHRVTTTSAYFIFFPVRQRTIYTFTIHLYSLICNFVF